jgi:hypothetical protein
VEVVVMKNFNRVRIGRAVSAALGLVAMSSSASAQLDPVERQQYCEELAWGACYYPGGPGGYPAFRCWHDTYDACLRGEIASIADTPDKGSRRSDIRPA